MTSMAHLTCAAHTPRRDPRSSRRYGDAGIENILALGGDPPADLDLPPGEFDYAIDLVELVRALGDFSIGGRRASRAASPFAESSKPTGCTRPRSCRRRLRDHAVLLRAAHYFDLVESLRALGVDKPVIPGIMPVLSVARHPADVARCRARSSRRGWPRSCTRSRTTRPRCARSASRRRQALRRAARRRRTGAALLHAEPLDRDPRDLREPRARARRAERRSGRD